MRTKENALERSIAFRSILASVAPTTPQQTKPERAPPPFVASACLGVSRGVRAGLAPERSE